MIPTLDQLDFRARMLEEWELDFKPHNSNVPILALPDKEYAQKASRQRLISAMIGGPVLYSGRLRGYMIGVDRFLPEFYLELHDGDWGKIMSHVETRIIQPLPATTTPRSD